MNLIDLFLAGWASLVYAAGLINAESTTASCS